LRVPCRGDLDLEIAERKGVGHPDTLSDLIAEEASQALCRFYLKEAGAVMNHNVDKALLVGGEAEPAFGGGRIVSPMEIIITGRAVKSFIHVHLNKWGTVKFVLTTPFCIGANLMLL